MVLQMQPPWCQEEKESHFPKLLAIVLPSTAPHVPGFCRCKGTLLIPVHLIPARTADAFLKSCSLASQSPVCADNGYFFVLGAGFFLLFLNFMRFPSAHSSSLLGSPALWCIDHSPQHGVASELPEGAHHPVIQGIN